MKGQGVGLREHEIFGGLGFRLESVGFRIQGLGLRLEGQDYRDQGSGLGAKCFGSP